MAERKKTPISTVNEDIISMEFDENPNIPTVTYSDDTAGRIQKAIAKKIRAEKLQKMIDNELKKENTTTEGESLGMAFNFSGM